MTTLRWVNKEISARRQKASPLSGILTKPHVRGRLSAGDGGYLVPLWGEAPGTVCHGSKHQRGRPLDQRLPIGHA